MSTTHSLPAVIDGFLTRSRDRFQAVLRDGPLTMADFELGVRSAAAVNPQLVAVMRENPASLFQALAEAAALRLNPHPKLGEFWLIPYNTKAGPRVDAMVGYRGLIAAAMQSGILEDLDAFCVYADQVESLKRDRRPLIDPTSGEPNIDPHDAMLAGEVKRDDQHVVGAIALARIRGRMRPIVRTMTTADIEKRAAVGAKGKGPSPAWREWFQEMAKKTALRSLLQSGRVPMGEHQGRLMRALELDLDGGRSEGPPSQSVGGWIDIPTQRGGSNETRGLRPASAEELAGWPEMPAALDGEEEDLPEIEPERRVLLDAIATVAQDAGLAVPQDVLSLCGNAETFGELSIGELQAALRTLEAAAKRRMAAAEAATEPGE